MADFVHCVTFCHVVNMLDEALPQYAEHAPRNACDAENYSRSIRNDTEYAYLLLICGAVHNRMTSQESNKNL